jgi:putative membrane protein
MKHRDFNLPQRQSMIGIVVLFADTFQRILRGLLPFIAIWIFKIDQVNKVYFSVFFLLLVIVLIIIAYLKYINFTFFIDQEQQEFVINKGVFNKTKITIQLSRVQQVNINQSFIQRIIGVYALEVDSAGSNEKEIKINAIEHQLALELKARLMDYDSSRFVMDHGVNAPDFIDEQNAIKISFFSLLKMGLTSKYGRTFSLILAFIFTIYENLKQWSVNYDAVGNKIDAYIDNTHSLILVPFFLIFFIIIVLVINLIRIILKYYDLKISKQNKSLVLSYGLIDRKSTIIKSSKVQVLTISNNFLQKKLGVLNIKIKQAAVNESEKENQKSSIEIPGANPIERDEILKLLFSKIPTKDFVLIPNTRKVIVSGIKYVLLPVIFFLIFIYLNVFPTHKYLYLIPIYILVVGFCIYFGFKNDRLFISNDHIIKQSGIWDIDQEIIEIHKIQSIAVHQFFWHNKSNIGSLTLYTAGGSISFSLANFSHIKKLVNKWLYQVETTTRNWNS